MKEIQTNGITILLVEVPEGAKSWDIEVFTIRNDSYVRTWSKSGHNSLIDLPQGQYQILGKSTELSEEQMKEICASIFGKYYFDYMNKDSGGYAPGFTLYTVQESYLSLLEANGIVDRNPYGDYNDEEQSQENTPYTESFGDRVFKMEAWKAAQSKVKHYLVLKRI